MHHEEIFHDILLLRIIIYYFRFSSSTDNREWQLFMGRGNWREADAS